MPLYGTLDLTTVAASLPTLPDLDMPRLHGFAERFAKRGEEANADWRALNYLFDGWLKGLMRQAALTTEAAPVVPTESGLRARLLPRLKPDKGHATLAAAFVAACRDGTAPPIPHATLLAVSRVALAAAPGQCFAQGVAGLAPDAQETPGHQPAVVGHAHGGCQQGL